MTQASDNAQTATEEGIEPDALVLMALMIVLENAEVHDLPVTGPVIAFPSVL